MGGCKNPYLRTYHKQSSSQWGPKQDTESQTPSSLTVIQQQHLHHSPFPITFILSIHSSIYPSIHPHLISALSRQQSCMSAQHACAPLFVCVCVCVCVCVRMYVRGSSCMSWPSPACRFMLLIGCMSCYTIASHDWSYAAQHVMARAVTAPGRTDKQRDKK